MSAIWWTILFQMLVALVKWLASDPKLTTKDRQRVAKAMQHMYDVSAIAEYHYGITTDDAEG